MSLVLFGFPGNERLTGALVEGLRGLGAQQGELFWRRFPDGESYVRLDTPVDGRQVILVCTLDRPDEKLLPLAFAAEAARDLGAGNVGVIAPYLAYMRQDIRFQTGEAVTAKSFAALVSRLADWLICVDPHLHRFKALREIYSIPTSVVHAAPAMAEWIAGNVNSPVIIGPDGESEQWVSEVAREARAPFAVLEKQRRGDRDVKVSLPDASRWRTHTPVLVDDIISTAGTMIATVELLVQAGLPAPVCLGVHAVFAGQAYARLKGCGAADVITCNTIAHASNAIDVHAALVERAKNFVR